MFAALNNFISSLDAGPEASREQVPYGFQILSNPRSDIPLEPWFDFIVGINGRQIYDPTSHLFVQEIRNCAGASVAFTVWSAKGQQFRTLRQPVPAEKPDLGLTLQWNPVTVTEQVWHILEVTPNSPAEKAGLLSYSDYVIGSPAAHSLQGERGLPELIEHHLDRELPLYIYNHESDVTRPLSITPSRRWGGQGALGCVLGYGALHRLPQPLTAGPAPEQGDVVFDYAAIGSPGEEATFIPASQLLGANTDMALSASTSPAPNGPARASDSPVPIRTAKPKRTQAKAAAPALDDYFDEGEKESKSLDYSLGPKAGPEGIAPPPKSVG